MLIVFGFITLVGILMIIIGALFIYGESESTYWPIITLVVGIIMAIGGAIGITLH